VHLSPAVINVAWYDCFIFSLGQEQRAQIVSGGDLTTEVLKIDDVTDHRGFFISKIPPI
jgi:hypothetical protein